MAAFESLPMNNFVRVFHHDDFVLFQHRHHHVLQFALPKVTFIKLRFHRLARIEIRKATHEKEGVGIFDGKKWAEYFHPDFCMCRNRLRAEYLNKLVAFSRLGLVGTHLDNHFQSPPASLRGPRKKARMHFPVTWLHYGYYSSVDLSQSTVPTKCPLTAALNAIGGKWSLICLYWLASGTRRFNELRRLMPDISHKVLGATLRSLEQEGLVCRTV